MDEDIESIELSSKNSVKGILRGSRLNSTLPSLKSSDSIRKKVAFVDRAKKLPLFAICKYEQVELIQEENKNKSSSCTCSLF